MSAPGDPVVMYAAIDGTSDNPSPMGWMGSGAAVDELNMALSPASEAGPRPPEMRSADSPNSSAQAFNGEQDYSERSPKKAQRAYLREERDQDPRPCDFPMTFSKAANSLKQTRRLSALTGFQVHLSGRH